MALQPRRELRNLVVDEISVVNRAANPFSKICILKRDDTADAGRHFDGYPVTKRRAPPSFKSTGEAKRWLFDEGRHFPVTHRDTDLQTLAEHLVDASGGTISKQHEVPMTREEFLTKSIARYGVDALVNAVLKVGAFVSEEELVKACGDARAFSRLYEGTSPRSKRLQKAIAICKGQYDTVRTAEAVGADMLAADDDLEMQDELDYDAPEHARGGRAAWAAGGQQMTDEEESDGPSHRSDEGDEDDDSCDDSDGRTKSYNKLEAVARKMVERGEVTSIAKGIERLYSRNAPVAVAHWKQHRRQMGM
jgi:hypothetical protein